MLKINMELLMAKQRKPREVMPVCACGLSKRRQYIKWESDEKLAGLQVEGNKIYICPKCDVKKRMKKSKQGQVDCMMCGRKMFSESLYDTCKVCRESASYKNADWVGMM